jgi:hypothetical protein
MDFWIAVVSGGAAVLGATVGGLVAALPAWGAEKRAAETARRSELRHALLAAIEAMDQAWQATNDKDDVALRAAASRFLQANATLGTLVDGRGRRTDESAIPSYLSTVLRLVTTEHPRAQHFVTEASVLLPAWYRGTIKLKTIAGKMEQLVEVKPPVDKDATAAA